MTQPILFKNSISIALLAVTEAGVASLAAMACLFFSIRFRHLPIEADDPQLMAAYVIIGIMLMRKPAGVDAQLNIHPSRTALSVVMRFILAALIIYILGKKSGSYLVNRKLFWAWVALSSVVMGTLTYSIAIITQKLLLAAASNRRAVFAGYNEASVSLAQRLREDASLCLEPCGFFDDRSEDRLGMSGKEKLNGTLRQLSQYVKNHNIDVIFIALPIRHLKRVMDLLDDLRDTTASIYYVPDVFVFDLIQARSTEIKNIPVVAMCETPFYGYRGISKRLLDVIVASIAVLLLSPVLIFAAISVKLSSPGPIIFKQRRYGLDGSEIPVYKFRSMKVTEDGTAIRQASKNDSRITPVGKFLRKSSIDELPQLFNVLNGTMSLVGPRPHAIAHNEEYRKLIKGYMLRHKVPPGITGLAQVSGCRGETAKLEDMERRVKHDIEYQRHWSLWLDIKVLFLTALQIFRDKQAY
jgi:putative colanic acid biosysnthesis UDP-glucose lipid carrier transferase